MSKVRRSETEVAAPVVFWLESLGHDVYQEVDCWNGYADIVALVGKEDWVVEVKANWSLDLLHQCIERRLVAHRVYAAVPASAKDRAGWQQNAAVFEHCGIGVLRVDFGDWYPGGAAVTQSGRDPKRNRPSARQRIRRTCRPGHKTHAQAGAAGGGRMPRFTEFRATAERLVAAVVAEPGIKVHEAIAKIEHHYATAHSARNHLARLVRMKVIEGIELRFEDGTRLYPVGASQATTEAA